MTNRSDLFTVYNLARPVARSGRIDAKRLNRALGLAQSSQAHQTATFMVYQTTTISCKCADSTNRKLTCKHMLAKQLLELAK